VKPHSISMIRWIVALPALNVMLMSLVSFPCAKR
jgi:hypothetical protein